MDGSNSKLLLDTEQEVTKILESIQIRANYGALVFSTLIELNGGENIIEDTIARYRQSDLIGKFNAIFDSLASRPEILEYSDEDWLSYYYEMAKSINIDDYLQTFNDGLFARSFSSQMYSYDAPAFAHLSEDQKLSLTEMQSKYAPIPLYGFLVASQIIQQLSYLHSQYGYTSNYEKTKN